MVEDVHGSKCPICIWDIFTSWKNFVDSGRRRIHSGRTFSRVMDEVKQRTRNAWHTKHDRVVGMNRGFQVRNLSLLCR